LKLSSQKIALLAEIVGGVAVVVSLIYLGVQVRNQNIEARASALQDFYVGWRESTSVFTDESLVELAVKGDKDFESLTETERLRLFASLHSLIRLFEESYLQHRQDRLDPELWAAMNRQFSQLFASSIYQRYWEKRSDWYHIDFQNHVDDIQQTEYEY
jgi:hypothetical protein